MGNQGWYTAEGEPVTRRDLATLPKDTVLRCHVHAQHEDPVLRRILRSAQRNHREAPVLPKRSAAFGRALHVPPADHDGTIMATDYMVTLTSDPLKVSKRFGVPRPDFHGGRKKAPAREIAWLKAPTEKPRAPQTRSRRLLRRIDQFKR